MYLGIAPLKSVKSEAQCLCHVQNKISEISKEQFVGFQKTSATQ